LWWAQPQIAKDPAFNHVVFASIMDTKSALSTDLTLVGDHIYTTGQFKGSITVEEGYPLVSQGSMDAFVAKVRASLWQMSRDAWDARGGWQRRKHMYASSGVSKSLCCLPGGSAVSKKGSGVGLKYMKFYVGLARNVCTGAGRRRQISTTGTWVWYVAIGGSWSDNTYGVAADDQYLYATMSLASMLPGSPMDVRMSLDNYTNTVPLPGSAMVFKVLALLALLSRCTRC
jgi:hypothetical protein